MNQFAESPALFRAALTIPGGRGPVKFAKAMADFQAKDFEALDAAFAALAKGDKPSVGRLWLERTKGASKDSDLAVMILWLVAYSPRALTCQVGAADADQADELRKAAKAILRLNPWVKGVEIQGAAIFNRRTESRCDIIAADVTGSHGARPDLLVLNELSHVGKQEFAENLMDNASKVPHGVVVIATNAGFTGTWQETWRETALSSERWYFSAHDRPAPWLDEAEIAEARLRNSPARFARLWGGVWASGDGDALDAASIDASITQPGPLAKPEMGWVYFAGLDLGIVQDHSALVVIGRNSRSGRLKLAQVHSWAPAKGQKVELSAVEAAVLKAHEVFHAWFCYDAWQAELLAERCRKRHVKMEAVAFSGKALSEMATALLERFNEQKIDLYHEPGLITDLRRLRIAESPAGYRLVAERTKSGHCDKATGLALAIIAAKRHPGGSGWCTRPPSVATRLGHGVPCTSPPAVLEMDWATNILKDLAGGFGRG